MGLGVSFLEGTYSVMLGRKPVGKVQVQRQGLYFRFRCNCEIPDGLVYRLQIACGGKQENLGIPVPMGSGFELDTKLPIKRIGEGSPEFHLISKWEKASGFFAPIYPEEPFAYLARLKTGYLMKKNGQTGIWIKERPGC